MLLEPDGLSDVTQDERIEASVESFNKDYCKMTDLDKIMNLDKPMDKMKWPMNLIGFPRFSWAFL